MQIEFDSTKRGKTLAECDLDFVALARCLRACWMLACLVLAWTPRGEVRRIISMRKANDREKIFYARHLD